MNAKKITAAALALNIALAGLALPAAAAESSDGGEYSAASVGDGKTYTYGYFKYEIREGTLSQDGTVKITDYTGSEPLIRVPASIDGRKVSYIDLHFTKKLKSTVILPAGDITTELECINHDSSMYFYKISDNGDMIFNCYFGEDESITIPSAVDGRTVTEINYWAVNGNKKLKNVIIPKTITRIYFNAFVDCENLKDIYYTGSEADWDKINIGSNNEDLFNATIHYNYVPVPTPAKVRIKGSSLSTKTIRVKWGRVANASGYRVYMYDSKTKKYKKYKTISGAASTECSVKGLKSGTSYKFKVKAYAKKDGKTKWGEASNEYVTATIPTKVTFTKVNRARTSVRLYWKKIPCTAYKVQRYVPSRKKWVTVKNVSGTNIKIAGLKPNTTYKFRVKAFKKAGSVTAHGSWSAVKKVTTKK